MTSIRVHCQHHGNHDGTELTKVKQSPITKVPGYHSRMLSGSKSNYPGLKSSSWHLLIVDLQ